MEIHDDNRKLALSAAKPSRVLSLLLLNHGQVVATRTLMEELWGDNPPVSSSTTLQTYIYQLRKLLSSSCSHGAHALQTHSAGYRLQLAAGFFDLDRFTDAMNRGQREQTRGEHDKARSSLTEALGLWRGQALAGLELGPQLQARATGLEELRARTLEMRIEASLAIGLHREAVGELRMLTAAEPYREGLASQLMIALYRSERRSEALEVYRRLHRLFIEELGIDPSPKIRKLHEAILKNDASIDFHPQGPSSAVHLQSRVRPAQLPADIPDFICRTRELAHITSALGPQRDDHTGRPPSQIVITGMTGVGKSALAVHAAHGLRAHYPDGQLYVRLRRAGHTISPSDALGGMLQAVGFPPTAIPANLEERSHLFRSWAADRKLLVLIDDAVSANQVEPLLPAGIRSAAIITSQSAIGGLPGAETVRLSPLGTGEATQLLALLAGKRKVAAEPEAAAAISQICGGLPLAIRICAARVTRRSWSLSQMLARLADHAERLNELCTDGLDMRRDLATGLASLTRREISAFQQLGTMRADTFTTTYAACELMAGVRDTERLLDRLHEASVVQLLGENTGGEPLWHFHPLMRSYAVELAYAAKDDVRSAV
ncbi:AfsR/SARP family transcriptional regulator [Sinosporangium siamense]|uniref:AfsR/SARP family transcriptional regulator n=1 Tax=Sinosporangium siamense TaxID=1367973 RepID=UPI0036D40DE4